MGEVVASHLLDLKGALAFLGARRGRAWLQAVVHGLRPAGLQKGREVGSTVSGRQGSALHGRDREDRGRRLVPEWFQAQLQRLQAWGWWQERCRLERVG